ncbi:uncharacterized protein LOC112890368 [Panicum hallii]|uniref:uncharacterized protein LOC112890368 n=1 Tax=Panicum hallii TaxID=206008 RepID=UPI000DF4E40C|nr:uncharacterized protein LOC112890368 [Panicum hallii]
MGISRSKLCTSVFPFLGIILGMRVYPLGNIDLPVMFGNCGNFRTETLILEVVDFKGSSVIFVSNFGSSQEKFGWRNEGSVHASEASTPAKIAGNPRWDSYFKDCIGAIDGTHVRASVPKHKEASFRGRKSYPTQNVMAAVDFNLRFTFVLAGWEGTAYDALVLRDALERENGLRVPQGKFYLVDAGYGAKPGFLPPFHGVRYHLNEWGNNPVQNEKELFNHRHSSLRVTVERAFGSLKRRFKILDDATPFFPFSTQVEIVVACCIIHNWVIQDGGDDFIIDASEELATINHHTSSHGQAAEHAFMVNFKQELANAMWEDYHANNI